MPGRALKVFQAHLGFFDTVVAVPSKKAALEAWGSRQDLFHTGLASLAEDKEAIGAALKHPGIVLRRPAGSREPFAVEPGLPKVKAGPKKSPAAKQAPPAPVGKRPALKLVHSQAEPKRPPAPPDRSALDAAERALADFQKALKNSEAEFVRRKKELLAEEQRWKESSRVREREFRQRLAAAKRDYSRALRESK